MKGIRLGKGILLEGLDKMIVACCAAEMDRRGLDRGAGAKTLKRELRSLEDSVRYLRALFYVGNMGETHQVYTITLLSLSSLQSKRLQLANF